MKKQILVIGAYGESNFGDDVLMHSIHTIFLNEFHSYGIIYKCNEKPYLKKIIKNASFLDKNEDYPDGLKIIIYGGGTQFFSFSRFNLFAKINSRIKLLFKPRLFLKTIEGKYRKEKLIINGNSKIFSLGIGIGPFKDKAIEKKAKINCLSMDYIAVRDINSFELCEKWSLLNHELYTDICFSYKHQKFSSSIEIHEIKKIAIVVRDWVLDNYGGAYSDAIIKFVDHKRNQGYDIKYVVFSKDKDIEWLKYLKAENESFVLWDPDTISINNFIETLSCFDLFISARFHGAVFASLLRKPFISIEVDPKLKIFSDTFSKSSENWSYPFNLSSLTSSFNKINKNYSQFVERLNNETEKQIDICEKMKESFIAKIKYELLQNEK